MVNEAGLAYILGLYMGKTNVVILQKKDRAAILEGRVADEDYIYQTKRQWGVGWEDHCFPDPILIIIDHSFCFFLLL